MDCLRKIASAEMAAARNCPVRVTSAGGKYGFPDDDQETPDTNIVTFDFGGTTSNWEQGSWAPHTPQDPAFEIAFYGNQGRLTINGSAYTLYDLKGKEIGKSSGNGGNTTHLQNFADTIRDGKKLNAEIEEGYKSVLLCHLGNIAYRTGHTIHFDSKSRKIVSDPTAERAMGPRLPARLGAKSIINIHAEYDLPSFNDCPLTPTS